MDKELIERAALRNLRMPLTIRLPNLNRDNMADSAITQRYGAGNSIGWGRLIGYQSLRQEILLPTLAESTGFGEESVAVACFTRDESRAVSLCSSRRMRRLSHAVPTDLTRNTTHDASRVNSA